jgi:5-methyltetrahydrofolate--homocysteine methyltransferase
MTDILQKIASHLYNGEQKEVAQLVEQALGQGLAPGEVLQGGLITGMEQVGRDFKAGDLFVPEVLIAARAMQAGMNVLRPLLGENDPVNAGKYVIGTVKGDLHDIGKNLVKMMLEGAGFQTIDLGTDVAADAFVAAVRTHRPKLLGMSALLTTTMVNIRPVGLRSRPAESVKIMVGGALATAAFASRSEPTLMRLTHTVADVARSLTK